MPLTIKTPTRSIVFALLFTMSLSTGLSADTWEDKIKKTALEYADKKKNELIQKASKKAILELYKKIYPRLKNKSEKDALKVLGGLGMRAREFNSIASDLASGDPKKVQDASDKLAVEVGKQVLHLAKMKRLNPALRSKMSTALGSVKDVSTHLGSLAGGDATPLCEYAGDLLIKAAGGANVVGFYRAAYGAMKFTKDAFVDSEIEGFYQQYKSGKFDPIQFDLAGGHYAIRDKIIAEKKKKASELKGMDIPPKLRAHLTRVDEEKFKQRLLAGFKARAAKERKAKADKIAAAKAATQAEQILNVLKFTARGQGRDHWTEGDSMVPIKFIERVLREAQKDPFFDPEKNIDLRIVARLLANEFVHGVNSPEYKKALIEFNKFRNIKKGSTKSKKLQVVCGHRATIGRAAGKQTPSTLKPGFIIAKVSGRWKGQPTRAPSRVSGPLSVPCGGKLRAEITGTPPAPNKWSLGNWNTGMTVFFRPRHGKGFGPSRTIINLAGQTTKNKLSGEGTWPCAGQITVVCNSPGGGGSFNASQFEQSYTGKVVVTEVTPDPRLLSGKEIVDGDRLKMDIFGDVLITDGNTFVHATRGADLKFNLNSDKPNTPHRFDLAAGKVRIVDTAGGRRPNLQLTLNGSVDPKTKKKLPGPIYSVTPTGTDYEVQNDRHRAFLRVYDGSIAIKYPDGKEIELTKGQELKLPHGKPGAFDYKRNIDLLVKGVALADIPMDSDVPEPYGTIDGPVSGGKFNKDWIWQDPKNDCIKKIPDSKTLIVTVPHGNDLLRSKTNAPRLLHKVTGDFDFESEVNLESKDPSYVHLDFLLYSPGSYIGYLAKQQLEDGLTADYRLLSGCWKSSNKNYIGVISGKYASYPKGPIKVRVSRRGKIWQSHWSRDGQKWTLFFEDKLDIPDTVWIGYSFRRDGRGQYYREHGIFTVKNIRITTIKPKTTSNEARNPEQKEEASKPATATQSVPVSAVGNGVIPTPMAGVSKAQAKEAAQVAAIADALRRLHDASGGVTTQGNRSTGQWTFGGMTLVSETVVKDRVAESDQITLQITSRSGAKVMIVVKDFVLQQPKPATCAGLAGYLTSRLKACGYTVTTRFVEQETICEATITRAKPPAVKPVVKPAVKPKETMLFTNGNPGGVQNKPTAATTFKLAGPTRITYVMSYHWNGGRGKTPGTIALCHADGTVYGPWKASARRANNRTYNTYWECRPNVLVKPGTYTIVDSDPTTWAQNTQSGGRGMVEVKGTKLPALPAKEGGQETDPNASLHDGTKMGVFTIDVPKGWKRAKASDEKETDSYLFTRAFNKGDLIVSIYKEGRPYDEEGRPYDPKRLMAVYRRIRDGFKKKNPGVKAQIWSFKGQKYGMYSFTGDRNPKAKRAYHYIVMPGKEKYYVVMVVVPGRHAALPELAKDFIRKTRISGVKYE
ncbi:MAG: hypothetical protein HN350_16660 [Phycisphaerales bacterium]|jgi:hypothetical protein|nr:hypothetical protein [Phycisphaerales bacterium]